MQQDERFWKWFFIALIALAIVSMLGQAFSARGAVEPITICRDTAVEWPRYDAIIDPAVGDSWGYLASGASLVDGTLIMDGLMAGDGGLGQELPDGHVVEVGDAVVQTWAADAAGEPVFRTYVGSLLTPPCATNATPLDQPNPSPSSSVNLGISSVTISVTPGCYRFTAPNGQSWLVRSQDEAGRTFARLTIGNDNGWRSVSDYVITKETC